MCYYWWYVLLLYGRYSLLYWQTGGEGELSILSTYLVDIMVVTASCTVVADFVDIGVQSG